MKQTGTVNIAGADQADDTVKGPMFPRDGRRQHLARVTRLALFVVAVASAVLLVWPQAFGAQWLPGIAQLIAFRAPVGIALAALAVVAGVAALVRRRGHRALTVGIAVVLAAAAVANAGMLVFRGSVQRLTTLRRSARSPPVTCTTLAISLIVPRSMCSTTPRPRRSPSALGSWLTSAASVRTPRVAAPPTADAASGGSPLSGKRGSREPSGVIPG